MLINTPVLKILIGAGIVFLVTLLARWLIFRFIPPLLDRHSPLWSEILEERRVLRYLYLSVPGIVIAILVQITPNIDQAISTITYKTAIIFSIVMLTMALISAMNAYGDYYDMHYDFANQVPIKPVIQTAVAFVVIFSVLTILAIALGVSLLAMAGVFFVIASVAYYLFREPLLGFAASLQLSMNRMLGIGDWMEMKQFGVDGEVEEINLTSTKVRNWDNSIVNVPTNSLIKNPFQNWESMQSQEARRVLRPIYLDQNTISFVSAVEEEELLALVSVLYENLPPEMQKHEDMRGVTPADLQQRDQLTNLEIFMAYTAQLIAGHPQTRADRVMYVRQQDPTPQGLPVETFFFTRATDFVPYHAVQREIYSHLLAILPQFGLRPYQTLDTS